MQYDDLNGIAVQEHIGGAGVRFSFPGGYWPRMTRYGSAEARRCGLLPAEEVPGIEDLYASRLDVIRECNEKKIFPVYHLDQAGALKKDGKRDWYQNGYGYCWAFGVTCATMAARALAGMEMVRLSPWSLGWLVNWRNSGYYLDGAIRGVNTRGIAPEEYVPGRTINPSRFKEGWEEEAKKYRITEWVEIPTGRDTQTVGYCLSALRNGWPLYVAYNWWSHALVCSGMVVRDGSLYDIGWVLENSHGEDKPLVLTGPRGVPSEAYAIIVPTAAA